jgi:hypothetical protein
MVAAYLSTAGSQLFQRAAAIKDTHSRGQASDKDVEEAVACGAAAVDALETAVLVDRRAVVAYGLLAILLSVSGKPDDALKYAKQGIAVIREIRQSDVPFHKSSIESVRNASARMQETEMHLMQLAAALEQQAAT